MKSFLFAFFVVAALGASGALEISNVRLRQDWPWSNAVKLTYELSGLAEGDLAEAVVSMASDGRELPFQSAGLSGDIYSLSANGEKTITIDPVKAFGKGVEFLPKVKMSVTARAATAASTNVLYKIFDIKNKSVTDVTRGDLLNGKWGAVETDFGAIGPGYTTTLDDVVIWTGVTNDVAYKTTKIVLRKIPAGDFKGYAPGGEIPEKNNMTWTFDYWIGVFEVTQGQRKELSNYKNGAQNFTFGSSIYVPGPRVIGSYLPEQYVQNRYMYGSGQGRNATTNQTGTAGFCNYMRQRFMVNGIAEYDFELPTQVQWMRAMRAGADSYYYDGIGKTKAEVTAEQYNALACNIVNGGSMTHDDGSVTTNIVEVGSFCPNAYGLYDMLGNVQEFVREDGALSKWNDGGENVVTKIGGSNNGLAYGGAFDTSTFSSASMGQVHTKDKGKLNTGFRLCMQSMADGISLLEQ